MFEHVPGFEERGTMLAANGAALLGGGAANLALGRDRRFIGQFVELAPHMRPAEREAELLTAPDERGIAAVAVDLQDAGRAPQVRFGALTLAIGSINVGHQLWIIAAPWLIVACTRLGDQLPWNWWKSNTALAA